MFPHLDVMRKPRPLAGPVTHAHHVTALFVQSGTPSQLVAGHVFIVEKLERIMARVRAGICCGPVVLDQDDAANLGVIEMKGCGLV